MKETTLHIDGMTCHACEKRIEAALGKIPGVEYVKASRAGAKAVIRHDGKVGVGAFRAAVEKAGYVFRESPGKATPIALGIGIVLAALYIVANSMGAFNDFPVADKSIGYGMLVVIGLLTSVHCVAMCGGIAISQSVKAIDSEENLPKTTVLHSLLPGFLYNGARVISYTLVGALVGGLGSVFNFSSTSRGAITALAGFFMLWLGLKMMGIMPTFAPASGILPKPLKQLFAAFSSRLSGRGPFLVGLLGGLMPCGPLQTMQLYALGTGSVAAGALSMFLFSIGTVPLMLVFGAAATVLPRKFMPVMIKASAVLVLLLGTLTLGRAFALAGIAIPVPFGVRAAPGLQANLDPSPSSIVADARSDVIPRATIADGVQIVVTSFDANDYKPFYVQTGIPVRWVIRIKKEDINGCNRTVIVPAYGIRKDLEPGDNVVEFTPTKAGIVPYSCWMGMITSAFSVVADLGKIDEQGPGGSGQTANGEISALAAAGAPSGQGSLAQALAIPGSGAASTGGCCGSGTSEGLDLDHIGLPKIHDGLEEITVKVGANGYTPSAIVLQKGLKAIIHFEADELDGCNDVVVFPDFNGSLDLSQGQLSTPELPVTGDFTFQCSMNMLHGYVKTVDDVAKVNLGDVRKELASWVPPAGGGCCGN